MLQVKDSQTVGPRSRGILAHFDGFDDVWFGVRSETSVQRIFDFNVLKNSSGFLILFELLNVSILSTEVISD